MNEKLKSFLQNRNRCKIKLGFERIKKFLTYLGNPQDKFKSVLITGTNGKGSVTFYLSNLSCKLTKYKTGRYTSPHLILWNERFVINEKIQDNYVLNEIQEAIPEQVTDFENNNKDLGEITEFEIYTSIAFKLFEKKKVDVAFLEIGMGGRLDATNVVSKNNVLCSIITNISYDHTQYLGNTIEKIALEKAGIIKENNYVITGAVGTALEVISEKANKLNSKLILTSQNKNDTYLDKNKQIVLSAWEVISAQIKTTKDANMKRYLEKLQFPGRFHLIKEHNILLDGAHNPEAAFELKKLIYKHFPDKKIIYILGILDKDYEDFIENLIPKKEDICVICTEPKSKRATKKEVLEEYILQNYDAICKSTENVRDAIFLAKQKEHDLIVITGSLYLVGEVLELIRKGQFLEPVLK